MQSVNIKKKSKNSLGFTTTPSNIISFRYSSIALVITLILMLIVPKVLNYAPRNNKYTIWYPNVLCVV